MMLINHGTKTFIDKQGDRKAQKIIKYKRKKNFYAKQRFYSIRNIQKLVHK